MRASAHSIVEKNGADEGSIAFADGRIYFVQGDMENGDMIYRVKCDGGVRRQFTYGSLFALSGNKEYMAINAESGAAASSTGKRKAQDIRNGFRQQHTCIQRVRRSGIRMVQGRFEAVLLREQAVG